MEKSNMISISAGNIKLGDISSVSLPAVITCRPDAPCFQKCYARHMQNFKKNCLTAWTRNLDIYRNNPESYWLQLRAHCSMVSAFRFHVSGDIPDIQYLEGIIKLARECRNCQFLMFTKRAEWVNDKISALKKQKKALPKNLHILLSNWGSWTLPNPYGLPVTNVIPRHTTPAEIEKLVSDGSTICPSKHGEWGCADCFKAGINCWAKGTKQILFPEH